jgi:bifunctional DNA-binding transcriptional regulator/antitoxin component of YhaV-PrlF toxin-antitoxin module
MQLMYNHDLDEYIIIIPYEIRRKLKLEEFNELDWEINDGILKLWKI